MVSLVDAQYSTDGGQKPLCNAVRSGEKNLKLQKIQTQKFLTKFQNGGVQVAITQHLQQKHI